MVKKNKLILVVEKTDTGFSAYSQNQSVFTAGSSIPGLMQNAFEAMGFYFEDLGMKPNHNTILFEIYFSNASNLSTKTRTEKNG